MPRFFCSLAGLILMGSAGIPAAEESYEACDRNFIENGFLLSATCYYRDGKLVDFSEIEKIPVNKRYQYYDLSIHKVWSSRDGKLSSERQHKPKQWFSGDMERHKEPDSLDFLPDYFTVLKTAILVAILFAIRKFYRMSSEWRQEDSPGRRYLVIGLIFFAASFSSFCISYMSALVGTSSRGIDVEAVTAVAIGSIIMLVASFAAYKFANNTYYRRASQNKLPKYRPYFLTAAIVQLLISLLFLL